MHRTMLVTDVEGSTRLAQGLGDRWVEVLAAQRRVMRRAIEAAGGTAEHTEGDSFFATFDDPRAAVTAARAAQEELAARRWPEGAQVRVRMGIHSGEVDFSDGHTVGVAAHLAARISSAAHGGQVLLSEETHALVEEPEARDLGRHRLKDFPEPVRLFQLASGRFPPPRTLGADAALELQERDTELQQLGSAVEALVGNGTGGVLLVEGPAGIGKSALVKAATEHPGAGAATVLRTHGSELESRLSFGGVRDLLAPCVLGLPADEREALLAGPASLARAVLGLTDEPPQGDPLYGLFWLVAALSERRPLLIAIDDLHWLDEESERFVSYLAQRLEGLPILLLATARPEREIAFAERATVLRPAPLTAEAVARLVPDQPPDAVLRVTGGNPLLAVEVARELATGEAGLDEVAPKGVARSVLARVARISEPAVALSRAVALSPEPLMLADAAALADLEPEAAAEAADALLRAEVFRSDTGALEFLHPVMRTAVYEELDPFARRRAHTRAARLLGDRGADVEAIAAHLLAGEPERAPENVRILRAAAERARRRVAPRAAARYLERALAEPPGAGQERVNLRFELGRLQLELGRPEAVATLRAALDEAPQPEQRADITADLADALAAVERYDEAVMLLERLLETGELDRERELKLIARCYWVASDASTMPKALDSYLARIPPDLPGDTPAQCSALIVLAYRRLSAGEPASAALELLDRTMPEAGAPAWLGFTDESLRFRMLSIAGDQRRANALATELLERARDTGLEAAYGAAQLQFAISANQRGELRSCEATLRLALEHPGLRADYRTALEDWLVTTLSMQGRFEEAEALVAALAEREPDFAAAMLERRRGEIALDRGDYASALTSFELLYSGRALDRLTPANSIIPDYARVLASLGRQAEALPLAQRAVAEAEAVGTDQARGLAYHALGVALEGEEGLIRLEQAVAILEDTPYRWNLANAQIELGAALRRRNQRARAREQLEAALEYAASNGAAPIEAAAREELRLCGARPRRAMRTGVDSLTPSEERIARMAAEGMSNKEIAQQLFVTVKNVEMHLVGAYRKLDVKSRKQLPDVFATA